MKKTVYKTKWDFKLFYTSDSDPRIEKDITDGLKAYEKFEKKYKKDKGYTKSKIKLLTALKDYERLYGLRIMNVYAYFYFRADKDCTNKKVSAKLVSIENRLQEGYNRIVFFDLELGCMTESFKTSIRKDKKFSHYIYFLETHWKRAQYNLSEGEEKIFNLLSNPAREMWVRGASHLLNEQTVSFEGKELPINQAFALMADMGTAKRRKLNNVVTQKLKEVSHFAESELNALYTQKKVSDELRGYKKPYSATILHYQNDEKTIENLVKVVETHNKISHRFYALKAKLLKQKKLSYADRNGKIGSMKQKFSFDEIVKITKESFGKVDQKYADMFQSFLENGQIDVYPKRGKTGGAYCWGGSLSHTMVLLNHADSFNSLRTTAHEMGHAFHTELSKEKQNPLYQRYTTSVAEVASTLFENFVFDEVFESLSKKDQIIALHDKINSEIATIFRQIAVFNFEHELHLTVREKGFVSKEEIANMMNKHMKAYLGPQFALEEDDGYFFVSWSHIRKHFYVYSYAFGEIVSKALYGEYKKDPAFLSKIEEFLSAGGSKSPYRIFKDIGIDVSKPDFFKKGLQVIEEDVKKLEKLIG